MRRITTLLETCNDDGTGMKITRLQSIDLPNDEKVLKKPSEQINHACDIIIAKCSEGKSNVNDETAIVMVDIMRRFTHKLRDYDL